MYKRLFIVRPKVKPHLLLSSSHNTNTLSLLKDKVLRYNHLNYGNPKERKHYYNSCAYRIKLLHLGRLTKAV